MRPALDVVIPFTGSEVELHELLARLVAVGLAGADTVLVADNRPPGAVQVNTGSPIKLVRAPARRSSYHARNEAARAGSGEWLLFLDADVEWDPGLLDAYFDPPPGAGTGIVGGAVSDAPLPSRPTVAERYAAERETMASSNTLTRDRDPYAQTANCLVRRAAFDAIGGFADGVRSGGDADLCFRLRAAGWELEQRPHAAVVHRNRRAARALLAQKARHGAGAAWVERRHPGTFPARRLHGLVKWSAHETAAALTSAQADAATRLLGVAAVWCFELGRLLPNDGGGLRHR